MLLCNGAVWPTIAIFAFLLMCNPVLGDNDTVEAITQGETNTSRSTEGSPTPSSVGPTERFNTSGAATTTKTPSSTTKAGVTVSPNSTLVSAIKPTDASPKQTNSSSPTVQSGSVKKRERRPERIAARLEVRNSRLTIRKGIRADVNLAKHDIEEAVQDLEIGELALERADEETEYRSLTLTRFRLPPATKFAYEEDLDGEVLLTGKLDRFTRFERVNVDSLDSVAKFNNLSSRSVLTLCTYFGHYYNKTIKGTTVAIQNECEIDKLCKGTEEHVSIDKVINFDNIKVINIMELPVIIIAYFTRHLGFTYNNLVMHEQIENCLFFYPQNPVACMENNWSGRAHPVVHLVIERKFLKHDSSITLCGLKKGNPAAIKGTWFAERHRLTIDLGNPETAGRRKLLAIERRRKLPGRQDIRCHSGSHLIKIDKYAATNEFQSFHNAKVGFCNNSIITHLPLGQEFGCYRVGSFKTHVQCKPYHHAYDGVKTCNVSSTEVCEDGELCAVVRLNGQGIVTARTQSGEVQVKHCLEECQFNFIIKNDLEISFTCPDGQQRRLHSNVIDANCPLLNKLGKYALYACRATHRPIILYTILIWLVAGMIALTVLIQVLSILVKLYCYFVVAFKRRLDMGKGICMECGESVPSTEEWQRHQSCKRGKCPYCGCKGSEVDIRKHAGKCLQKETVLEHDLSVLTIRRTPRYALRAGCFITSLQGKPTRVMWLITLALLFIFLIQPIKGFETNDLTNGIWEEGIEEVEYCGKGCWYEQDVCTCQKEQTHTSRHILSVSRPSERPAEMKENRGSKQVLRSLDVEAPWGTLHIPETFSPAGSVKHVSLSWESSKLVGKRVILSGKSTAMMKLNPRTSTSWEMTSPDANEKKILTLSILDYSQVYSSRFEYLTGDRKVTTWSEGSCTGPCPKDCGCNDPSCHTRQWLNTRNWRCNPTWCWGIGTGCSCCSAKVVDLYQDWLVSIWQIEHLRTPVVACLEFDHENRVCDVVEAGIEIQLGPVTVAFSDPFGEQKLLPQRIAVYHKRNSDHEHVDLLHNHGIGGAEQYCKLQSCTHGTAGDYQIINPDALVFDDVTSMNYFKKLDVYNKVWMSWEGVNLGYYCNPGDWTTCTAENIVSRNSEAFENRNNLERNYSKSHFFHSSRVYGSGKTLVMDLKGRPIQSGGNINVYVTVNNLELNSKKVVLEGLKVSLRACTGCFGCNLGAECQVSLSILEPTEFHLHLKSRTPGVTVPDTSFLVNSAEEKAFSIRIFSIQKESDFCVEILESHLCPDCNEKDLQSCLTLNLDDPKPVLLEHRSVLFSKSNKTCEGGAAACWLGSAGSLLKGIGSFLSNHFGSIFMGILLSVVPVLLLVCFILFFPQIMSFLRLFKKGRSVVGFRKKFYKPLTETADLGLTAEEKAFLSGMFGKKKE
uniref:M polyprotein n=1 Tax=Leopards Hill virus TaxID=1381104 RepID=A0A0C6DPR2_9VIRU|nr:glycoprotein precursor [Leopards Hill virus]